MESLNLFLSIPNDSIIRPVPNGGLLHPLALIYLQLASKFYLAHFDKTKFLFYVL